MSEFQIGEFMKSVFKRVSFSPRTAKFIEMIAKKESGEVAWSATINVVLEQFRAIISQAMPDLSNKEWEIIMACFAGKYMPTHKSHVDVAGDLDRFYGEHGVAEFGAEYTALLEKIKPMSQPQQLAILYFVQAFWGKNWRSYKSFDEIKAEILTNLM